MGLAPYQAVANNSPCSLLRAAMRLPPPRGAFFCLVIGGETGVCPRGIEARHPVSHSGHADVRGAQVDPTRKPWRGQTKRIACMAEGNSRTHALLYWASAQRVRAFTGGRSASRGRLTR